MSVGTETVTVGGRTAWARNLAAPMRSFLSTESGGAVVTFGAAVAALLWANLPWWHSYESVWTTSVAVRVGNAGVTMDLRHWVNEGLMTLFFLVVGLEAKRQLDLGELRERRRLAIPVFAAIGGITVPVLIYLAFNAGRAGAHGWGAAMSSDTAFALGAVALVTPRTATRVRVFLLTLAVVDDLAALLVIATVYTTHVSVVALTTAIALFAALVALRYFPAGRRAISVGLSLAIWVAMVKSGIDPVISGLAIGLATSAYPPSREDLERAVAVTRSFREQPTPELARSAQQSLQATLSANERLQYELHPWTSYVIVPVFALANAGIHLTSRLTTDAVTSPITLGILIGYLVGKPIGVTAGSWIASRPALHGPRSPLSAPAVVTAGACAGIGFTVSLLVSSLAFSGERLNEARLGTLATVIVAPALAWVATRVLRRLPSTIRARQIGRTAEDIIDLADDVDPEHDHVRGPDDAPVTLLEYGDFQCPYCGQAERVIRELLASHGDDIRYVWRHLPLSDVHPNAQLAAEASEAAAAQGKFWDMYDSLLSHQDELSPQDLVRHAEKIGLDLERFRDELRGRQYASRVSEDVSSADESGVSGTPTFFINGRRHYGVYDIDTLTEAAGAAKVRARQLTQAAQADGAAAEHESTGVQT
jgi:Na+/H+ antiporter NhaA